ncbi:MAG: TonB-dependent receptor plug domain-containing protein [Deltaproteobacteria bacterium]|nr:TonB-dependent receptor plug domain-containing protein [Deltaproteobacteria bacterium]
MEPSRSTPHRRVALRFCCGIGASLSLFAASAQAQSPPSPTLPAEPEAPTGEAIVRGRGQPPRGAGDVNITVGQLSQVPRSSAGDLLRLAPGMFLANGLGEGHADQVFLRGFDARSGQDLEFSVNGVPINEPAHPHGQGYADTHFLIPELVESLHVLEGPFDPRQGDFAVAGSAQYSLRLPARGAHIQYRGGSYNTHRTVALWGPEGESAGTFGGVELATSDGYGQNRSYERATANAQYEGRSGSLTWRVLAMSYGIRYRSAGVIREDDHLAGRVGFYDTYDPTQGSEVSRHLVSAEVDSTRTASVLRAQAWASLRSFRLRENFTGSLLDVQQPYQSLHAQRGDLIDQAASTVDVGMRASARLRTTWHARTQSLELGAYARHNTVDSTQHRLRATTDVPYLTDYSLDNSVSNLALYLDAELRPLSWVVLRGGIRADLFQYDVLDRCAVRGVTVRGAPLDAECLSVDRSGYRSPSQRRTSGGIAWQPRGSLFLGPWKGVTVAMSAGLGARSADPVYLGNDQQLPFSPITALEGGVVFDRRLGGFALNARALYYRTHVGQDLIFNETEGRNTLASGTTRQGALVAARATNAWLDLSAHLTYARATFDDDGKLVPYVPEWVARFDGAVHRSLPWRIRGRAITASAGVGATWVAPRPLPFSERGESIFTVDAQVGARWAYYELGFIAQNLFDAQYAWGQYNFTSDFRSRDYPTLVPARHFTAGPPRQLFVVFTLHLGATAARHGAPTETAR